MSCGGVNLESVVSYCYSKGDLVETPLNWNDENREATEFEQILKKQWVAAEENGVLKYKLVDCTYRVLKGDQAPNVKYVAQLNPQRGFNRRKREPFEDMNQQFSDQQFNFTKIRENEILINLKPGQDTAYAMYKNQTDLQYTDDNIVAVNISPIDHCHILLIPNCSMRHPQRLSIASLLLAMDLAQLGFAPGFRVGFNSIHAWASVNHLHYHAMLCNYKLFIDDLDSNIHLHGHCFIMEENFMISGFLFHIPLDSEKRIEVAKEMVDITNLFHEKKIPYNVAITRSTQSKLGTRAFLWPRKSTKHLDPSPCFDVACVEVGGQFPIKTKAEFDSLTFDKAKEILTKAGLDHADFMKIVDDIKKL